MRILTYKEFLNESVAINEAFDSSIMRKANNCLGQFEIKKWSKKDGRSKMSKMNVESLRDVLPFFVSINNIFNYSEITDNDFSTLSVDELKSAIDQSWMS